MKVVNLLRPLWHVHHRPGTRYYGATRRGRHASEAEAIAAGNRPAHGQRCRVACRRA